MCISLWRTDTRFSFIDTKSAPHPKCEIDQLSRPFKTLPIYTSAAQQSLIHSSLPARDFIVRWLRIFVVSYRDIAAPETGKRKCVCE